MRRWVVAILCGLLLQGCGPKPSDQVELTMWLVGSEAQARTINELAKAFREQTGVRVQCEAISWGEAHSKYLTAVAGGVEPDIGTMGLTWGIEFGRLGALIDLREAFPQDVASIQSRTFPGLWGSIEQGGKVFGIPLDLSLQVLYYRNDLIPQPPQTWDELTALLSRLRQENRRMIIDWGNLSWIGYAPFLWQAGGDFYHSGRADAALDSSPAVAAMEFFRDLYVKYEVPKTSVPVEQGLRTGEFPLVLSGNWKMISLMIGVPEIAGKWSIGLLPKGPSGKRTAFLGGRIMGIFSRSKHRDEAWQFIRYLFEPSVQQQLFEAGEATQDAYLPPNVESWGSLKLDPAMKTVLRQQAQEAKGPPAVVGWTESTHLLEAAIQRVILQRTDPRQEFRRLDEEMDTAIKKAERTH
jgi:ABC-type glycerol-3-phosphate transport system substrate-binding protein